MRDVLGKPVKRKKKIFKNIVSLEIKWDVSEL